MGKVITVMNMKGGVGKTTVSAHLAGNLAYYQHAKRYRSVLLIDYDPQFNLTQSYMPVSAYAQAETERKTVLSVLLEDPTKLNPFRLQVSGNESPPKVADIEYVVHKGGPGSAKLALIPSTLNLMYVALAEPETKTRPIEERFKKFVNEARESYDVVIIDCHPAGSIFTKTALKNSDHVIIPVVAERYSVRGVGLMVRFIEELKTGASGPTAHILFNRMTRGGLSSEETTIRSNANYTKKCITQTLKKYTAFTDPEGGKGFVWHSNKPYCKEARTNLWHVTDEIVTRLEL